MNMVVHEPTIKKPTNPIWTMQGFHKRVAQATMFIV